MRIKDMHEKFYSIMPLRHITNSIHPFYKFAIDLYAKRTIKAIENSPQTKEYFKFLKAQS